MDEETLKLILRAEFAEFRNEIERMLRAGLDGKIGQTEHAELVKRVDNLEKESDSLVSWRNRILGALAVVSLVAGAALEIAVKHYIH